MQNLCLISPLFSSIFLKQICLLLNDSTYCSIDKEIHQILIEFIISALTNSAESLIRTSQCNFLPSLVEFDVLSRTQFEHVHTSILSFLFSITMNPNLSTEDFLSKDFFRQLAGQPMESIEHYLQIYAICRMSSIRELGEEFPFLKTHRLYSILEEN